MGEPCPAPAAGRTRGKPWFAPWSGAMPAGAAPRTGPPGAGRGQDERPARLVVRLVEVTREGTVLWTGAPG